MTILEALPIALALAITIVGFLLGLAYFIPDAEGDLPIKNFKPKRKGVN